MRLRNTWVFSGPRVLYSEDDGPLNYERLRQISDAMMVVNETLKAIMGSRDGKESGVDGYELVFLFCYSF